MPYDCSTAATRATSATASHSCFAGALVAVSLFCNFVINSIRAFHANDPPYERSGGTERYAGPEGCESPVRQTFVRDHIETSEVFTQLGLAPLVLKLLKSR